MKRVLTALFVLSSFFVFSQGKSIVEVQCLPALSNTAFATLLSDNSLWWNGNTNNEAWEKIPTTGLPAGKKIVTFDVYIKPSLGTKSTRLIALLDDNTMWWYVENKGWEKVSAEGLPGKAKVKSLQPYMKYGLASADTRFLALMEDNSIYWYALNKGWEQIPAEGLPSNPKITNIGTYQKSAMMGTDTRFVITLADNTMWWSDGKKWKELEGKGLPDGASFKKLTAMMKIPVMGNIEGRIIGVLSDESIWWIASSASKWKQLETTGLPAGYKVKGLEVYQKYQGLGGNTRIILLLEDNSVWWYAENSGWAKVETANLLK